MQGDLGAEGEDVGEARHLQRGRRRHEPLRVKSHASSTPQPKGETSPMPVITTRRWRPPPLPGSCAMFLPSIVVDPYVAARLEAAHL